MQVAQLGTVPIQITNPLSMPLALGSESGSHAVQLYQCLILFPNRLNGGPQTVNALKSERVTIQLFSVYCMM